MKAIRPLRWMSGSRLFQAMLTPGKITVFGVIAVLLVVVLGACKPVQHQQQLLESCQNHRAMLNMELVARRAEPGKPPPPFQPDVPGYAMLATYAGRTSGALNCKPDGTPSNCAMKTLLSFATTFMFLSASLGQSNNAPTCYVHFGIGYGESAKRLLSAPVYFDKPVFASGDDYWRLTGHVEQHGSEIVANLMGSIGSQSSFYRGSATLEKPFFAQGGTASGGATAMWFGVSTNSDYAPLLEKVQEMGRQSRAFANVAATVPVKKQSIEFTGLVREGEAFERRFGNRFIFSLQPMQFGWEICVYELDRPENLAGFTPPFHIVPRATDIEGWNFRNATNTGPNNGDVNAPQNVREFIFSPEAWTTIQGPQATNSISSEEIERIRSFGNGVLEIKNLKLPSPQANQTANILEMDFRCKLTWTQN